MSTARDLLSLAARIADGDPVDWSAERRAHSQAGPIVRELEELQRLAGLLRALRRRPGRDGVCDFDP